MVWNKIKYLVLALSIICSINAITAQSSVKKLVKKSKSLLGNYEYDGFVPNEIKMDTSAQKVEIEFHTLANVRYRVVFSCQDFFKGVHITIYDKNKKARKRNIVFDNQATKNAGHWIFEPSKQGTYYIEYNIPSVEKNTNEKAIIVMMIGTNIEGERKNAMAIRED